ncbi:MAG: hypothetical protein COA78_15715 [Blastopirellula sp.]|nr:MAG: hypothetical protein COA78_15715 [Blastopirellula sp.]
MSKYHFHQRFHPPHDLRVDGVVQFLEVMQQAFGLLGWIDADEQLVDLRRDLIERALRSQASTSDLKRFGVNWVVKSVEMKNLLLVCIGVGGDEWCENSFHLDASRVSLLPDLSFFRQSIESIRPFEAFILEEKNDDELREKRQQQTQTSRNGGPLALHWFHYMNEETANVVGGLSHCLQTPAFKVERFCEGVLFQLTAEPFDARNPQHQKMQNRAMIHLGLE